MNVSLFRIIVKSHRVTSIWNTSRMCLPETDGWCNLRNTFQGHRCAQSTALAKGRRDAGHRGDDWPPKGGKPRDAIRRLRREAAPHRLYHASYRWRPRRRDATVGDEARKRDISRWRLRALKIKSAEENEKEQKYGTITPGESRYYWKLLTQWKWAIGLAGGPRWIVVIAVFHSACCPYLPRTSPRATPGPPGGW